MLLRIIRHGGRSFSGRELQMRHSKVNKTILILILATAASATLLTIPDKVRAQSSAPSIQTAVGYRELNGMLAEVEVILATDPTVDRATAAERALAAFGAIPSDRFVLQG